jgi:hypothetical protein
MRHDSGKPESRKNSGEIKGVAVPYPQSATLRQKTLFGRLGTQKAGFGAGRYSATKSLMTQQFIDEDEFYENLPQPVKLKEEGMSMKGLSWKFNKWIDQKLREFYEDKAKQEQIQAERLAMITK